MADRLVPLRRSLLVRLLGLVAVVALASIAATAWLTVHTTAVGLHEEQGEALRADARVADELTGYAATHHSWSGAEDLVRRLAASTGHRITLTDVRGTVLADSSTSGAPLPTRSATTIDPLDVGPASLPGPYPSCAAGQACPASYVGPPPGGAPIDARAVGPFLLTPQERDQSRALAERLAGCLRGQTDAQTTVKVADTGRASLSLAPAQVALPTSCDLRALVSPMATEAAPLAQLQTAVDSCLRRHGGPSVVLSPDLGWVQQQPRTTAGDRTVESCLTAARREQLAAYVAPAALLHVSNPRQSATTFLDLSTGNRWRIAEVALAVLLVGLAFVALAGRQLVRPLGALADAAQRVREGDLSARADVRARDEIGSVAAAFNTMAERRERAELLRKVMVGDVAHELRNPIATIRGSLEAAQDGLVAVDRALVDSLLEETLLLQHVVEDLRDLAAGDAGDLRLRREPVEVAELLDQVAAAHRGTVPVSASAPVGLTVEADPLRLRQLLGNLVANAVRHTPPEGQVTLTGAAVGAELQLRVRDTGDGIAGEDLPHVFERFWRADPSRSRASGGSGLGLAIVRQLAEAHGGSVSVTSRPGAGAEFVVRLPLSG